MVSPSVDPEVDRALRRIRSDGIRRPAVDILDVVATPRWESVPTVHDWRRHVPPALREQWDSLPLLARLCVFETAELTALEEDQDLAMVTGPKG